ncbi:MAG: FAD-dependent oxidoreductase [Casimicrobiaceae bacterium]
MRIAIVGSGIAGLGGARLLQQQGCRVTVFEANAYAGGHTHTVDVTLEGITAPVDTGFLVYNERTYPRLIALFAELGIETTPSTMSFAVRDDRADVEWAGTDLGSLFAQPLNLARPAFWSMLADILRFNRATTALQRADRIPETTLGAFLDSGGFGSAFRDWYLLPMGAAIWSVPPRAVLDFPLPSFVRFCHRHGLLQIFDRPQWRTVVGGARTYVRRIVAQLRDVRLATPVLRVRRFTHHVEVDTAANTGERFDQVVFACHSDQTRALLADATPTEARLLDSVRYQSNRVLLHTDTRLMPRRRRAWSAWNYLAGDPRSDDPVCVTYWINKLQPLPFSTPVLVTLNPHVEPQPGTLIAEFEYSHPVVKTAAVTAQQQFAKLQGARGTWYAGAWLGHGFHEDGLASAHVVAQGIAAGAVTAAAEFAAA